MEFKQQYSKEEVDELVEWFNTHTYEQDVDLGHGIHFTNVDKAVQQLVYIAKNRRENRNFLGQIYTLFRLRDALVEQGKVKS